MKTSDVKRLKNDIRQSVERLLELSPTSQLDVLHILRRNLDFDLLQDEVFTEFKRLVEERLEVIEKMAGIGKDLDILMTDVGKSIGQHVTENKAVLAGLDQSIDSIVKRAREGRDEILSSFAQTLNKVQNRVKEAETEVKALEARSKSLWRKQFTHSKIFWILMCCNIVSMFVCFTTYREKSQLNDKLTKIVERQDSLYQNQRLIYDEVQAKTKKAKK